MKRRKATKTMWFLYSDRMEAGPRESNGGTETRGASPVLRLALRGRDLETIRTPRRGGIAEVSGEEEFLV